MTTGLLEWVLEKEEALKLFDVLAKPHSKSSLAEAMISEFGQSDGGTGWWTFITRISSRAIESKQNTCPCHMTTSTAWMTGG